MVYIQKNRDGIPHHFDCACAMYGVMDLGLEYTLVTMEEVMNGKWDTLIRSRVFVGSVEFMTEVFKRIGIEQPKLPKNNLLENPNKQGNQRRPINVYDETGLLMDTLNSAKECVGKYKMSTSTLFDRLKNGKPYKNMTFVGQEIIKY